MSTQPHRQVRIQSVRRSNPDLRKLSRALIALALASAQAEADAAAEHGEADSAAATGAANAASAEPDEGTDK